MASASRTPVPAIANLIAGQEWRALAALRSLGGTVHMAQVESKPDGADTVVYSTAISYDHVELAEARRRGLRVLHRSEALAAAMTNRQAIAVACTHDTTTSIMTVILQHAGQDPSFVIGGEISEAGSNGHHGTGPHFVAEADESDKSFLIFRPYVAVITNIEGDHLNNWGDLDGLKAGFLDFARLTDADGFVVTCADDRPQAGHPAALDRGGAVLHPGVCRRFERKGIVAGVRVDDEYAYHPTSVKAALRTLREVTGGPHPRPSGRAGRRAGAGRRGDLHGGVRARARPGSRARAASR